MRFFEDLSVGLVPATFDESTSCYHKSFTCRQKDRTSDHIWGLVDRQRRRPGADLSGSPAISLRELVRRLPDAAVDRKGLESTWSQKIMHAESNARCLTIVAMSKNQYLLIVSLRTRP